jgi:hypothetical protein
MGAAVKAAALLFISALALTACHEEARTATEFTEATEQNATSARDTAVRPASIVVHPQDTFAVPQPNSAGSSTLALLPLTAVRTTGSVELKANGWSTIASVKLRYMAGGGTHEGFVHQGSCKQVGPTVSDLYPVSTDSVGIGASTSFIDIPLDTLRARPHAITFGRGGRPHSCADIN